MTTNQSQRRTSLLRLRTSSCIYGLCLSALLLLPTATIHAQSSPHGAFGNLINSVQAVRSGNAANKDSDDGAASGGGGSSGGGSDGGSGGGFDGSEQPLETAEAFYISDVEPVVQARCVVCHKSGSVADNHNPPARILFDGNPSENHNALEAFVSLSDVPADWLLDKAVGDAGHGGGPVLTRGSLEYEALAEYLTLTLGVDTSSGTDDGDFWSATLTEDRETTLRRAGILLAGRVPNQAMINRAKASEEALRAEILRLMTGDGFHDFLVNGANDRLLTMGLTKGLNFEFGTMDRFPTFNEFTASRPTETPEEFLEYWDEPFLRRGDADSAFRYGLARAPLELIAHIVETNKSYKQVVTANYTMVNPYTDLGFRSNAGFQPSDLMNPSGTFDRRKVSVFKPGVNTGHIPHDEAFEYDWESERLLSFSGYQDWPHSGVLSMPGWLARYPSTDTNRNRARARWTYFHFLDVDIEKSAPRSTDPDALADTNNPTLNNPACTVCHERMDPVAGSYQSFGDQGTYLDQWGGTDSLPESYKYPEWYGGEAGSTGYREGDTWYRDMRNPGFEGASPSGNKDSIQWLGQQIANDPRFAAATVKFWWPAIFGADVIRAPADPSLPGYEQKLMAFNAQHALVAELAEKFEASGFKAKQLFADMIMSPWFRVSGFADPEVEQQRSLAMETVGSGRLLTPQELDRKNKAVFGRTWRENPNNPHAEEQVETAFNASWSGLSTFYGGIDGAAVTIRNRSLTPLMSNVTELMATELSCQVVLDEFYKDPADRTLFTQVDRYMDPSRLSFVESTLGERYNQIDGENDVYEERVSFNTTGGQVALKVAEVTPNGCIQEIEGDDNSWICVHGGVRSVALYRNGELLEDIQWDEFEESGRFTPEYYFDDQTQQDEIRGWFDEWQRFFYGHTTSSFELSYELDAGDYEFVVEIGTLLPSNHPESGVVIQTSVHADGFDPSSVDGQKIMAQLEDLYLRATNRPIDAATRDGLLNVMTAHAAEERRRVNYFDGNCDTWSIWNDEWGDEWTDEQWQSVHNDPTGMMRAWTMVVHGLMTSFWYLHD